MSFIVQIIDAALPGDNIQRQRLIYKLVDEHQANDAEPGAALGKLYQQLFAQYPCLSTYKEDAMDECVWGDGPLIANFGQRIAVLDIIRNEEQVLSLILKLAGDLNLKVVDVQTDLVFYPKSQEAINFIVRHEKPSVNEKPLTENSVLNFIVEHLKPIFEPEGFVWDKKKKWFQRSVSYGEQCFQIIIEKKRERFTIFLGARLHICKVQEILTKILNISSDASYIWYGYGYFTGDYADPKISKFTELLEFTEELKKIIDEKTLSFFLATLVLEDANKLTNNSEKCQFFLSTFYTDVLTLAYLVQPSKIQVVADIYRNYIKFRNYSKDAYQKPIDDFVNKLIALNPTL